MKKQDLPPLKVGDFIEVSVTYPVSTNMRGKCAPPRQNTYRGKVTYFNPQWPTIRIREYDPERRKYGWSHCLPAVCLFDRLEVQEPP